MSISFLIPAFNAESTIGRALFSVLNNSTAGDEVLVVDDGSTDETPNIVRHICKSNPQVQFWSIPHIGIAGARKVLLSKASASFIQFVDADDYLLPSYKTKVAPHAKNPEPQVDIVCFDAALPEGRTHPGIIAKEEPDGLIPVNDYISSLIAHGTSNSLALKLFRRSLFADGPVCQIPDEHAMAEDLLLQLSTIRAARVVLHVQEACYYYDQSPTSLTHQTSYKQTRFSIETIQFLYRFILSNRDWLPADLFSSFMENTAKSHFLMHIADCYTTAETTAEHSILCNAFLHSEPYKHGLLKFHFRKSENKKLRILHRAMKIDRCHILFRILKKRWKGHPTIEE